MTCENLTDFGDRVIAGSKGTYIVLCAERKRERKRERESCVVSQVKSSYKVWLALFLKRIKLTLVPAVGKGTKLNKMQM